MRSFMILVVVLVMMFTLPGALQAQQPEAEILARGAALSGANGLAFDEEDRLYVASVGSGQIVVMDPNNGQILERFGADQGVQTPDDVTIGPDGSIYWTALFTGEVGRISPEGEKSTVAQLPPGANPITFSEDGRLFVALDFLGDALYELDPSGQQEPRLIAENLGWLNAFDFGPDGLLYGPLVQTQQVVRIDVDTGQVTPVAEGFTYPTAVKFDGQDRLHVVDAGTGEVVQVDPQTGEKTVLAVFESGLDNLAFDSQGRLFVSSNDDGFVAQVLSDGGRWLVSPGGMVSPVGVAVLPLPGGGASVFVADLFSLREFDGQAGFLRSVRHSGGPQQLTMPAAVAADGDNLILSSWFGNAVQVWSPARQQVLETYADFAVPLNAIRFQGDLVVAELGASQVVRASAANPAERTVLAAGLGVPAGLAATGQELWASDWAAGNVLQLVAAGERLAEPRVVTEGLANPAGLAVAPDGSLLVVESSAGRLSRVDPANGEVTPIAEGLEVGAPPMANTPPAVIGVAVGPSGDIYVAGDKARVVYRIAGERPSLTTIEDLAGVWWRFYPDYPQPGKYWWQINADGSLLVQQERLVAGRPVTSTLDTGTLWFDGMELQIQSQCSDLGRYQVKPDESGQLQFMVVDDPCSERKQVITEQPWQMAQ